MRIVLLGAPGSGKGTQSQRLAGRAGVPQVSTGDLLRSAVARGTELGLRARASMEAGRLVDDSLVLGLIRERLAQRDARAGFILDGFPRNLAQAGALGRLLADLRQPLEAVVQLEVDYDELVRRIAGRRTCADCGRVFNVLTPGPPGGSDERCPQSLAPHRLVQRPDDNEATVRERLRVYEEQTRPLIDFYRARGLLRVIDAAGELDEVTARLERALGELGAGARRSQSSARQPPKSARRRAAKSPARRPAKSAARQGARRRRGRKPRRPRPKSR
jgi:adenylate kinase